MSSGKMAAKLGPDRKRGKTRMFTVENVPTFLVVLILISGLLLFGADAPMSSLFISMFVFASALISVVFLSGCEFRSSDTVYAVSLGRFFA